MFVWLASYPKSGNTLVRALLSSYLYSNNGNFEFDLMKNIKQFPNFKFFQDLNIDVKNEQEVIKNYIKVQNSINKKDSVQFLKTHSYLFNINNAPFTDLENSLGAIYIVRDPRNVAISYAHHNSITIDEAVNYIIQYGELGGSKNIKSLSNNTKTYLGSWGSNYQSWKSFKSVNKYLLIRYEDLINNKNEIFLKILKFIHNLKKIDFNLDEKKFQNVLATTDFTYMQKLENENGFNESIINKKTGKKVKFFNLGKDTNWQSSLNIDLKQKIEKAFEKEMTELNYL